MGVNEQDANHLRDAIARGQGWTLCRCGHMLDCCADCAGWLIAESPRIAASWRWYVNHCVALPAWFPAGQRVADEAEKYYVAYYEAMR